MEAASYTASDLNSALSSLLELAGMPAEENVTSSHIEEAVGKLKGMLENPAKPAGGSTVHQSGTLLAPINRCSHGRVLIAGQVGIISHQLRQIAARMGAEARIAKTMDEAVTEFKRQPYSLVVIDLNMPTEREGLHLVDRISRMSGDMDTPVQIIALGPLEKDSHLRDMALKMGATMFQEKTDGWQKVIIHCLSNHAGKADTVQA